MPNPTYSSRIEIINYYIKQAKIKFDLTIEEIAKMTIGYCCAGIQTLINEMILNSSVKKSAIEKIIVDYEQSIL